MHHNTGRQDLLNAIGNTPLIRLKAVSDATGCDISVSYTHLTLPTIELV